MVIVHAFFRTHTVKTLPASPSERATLCKILDQAHGVHQDSNVRAFIAKMLAYDEDYGRLVLELEGTAATIHVQISEWLAYWNGAFLHVIS